MNLKWDFLKKPEDTLGRLIPPSEPASPIDMTKPRGTAEATDPNDKGWLLGDDAKDRFKKTPEFLQKTVFAERAQHETHSPDAKLLRIDVVRDIANTTTYLDITCGGCGAYRKLRLNETSKSIDVIAETMSKVAPVVPNAEDRLRQLEIDRESARKRNAEAAEAKRREMRADIASGRTQIGIPKQWLDQAQAEREIRYYSSAEAFNPRDAVVTKPLLGNIVRNPPAVKKVPKVDRLTLERAPLSPEDEV